MKQVAGGTKSKANAARVRSVEDQITHKSLKNLADSIYQTLREEGCENKDIIGVSSQLIGLVTQSIDQKK